MIRIQNAALRSIALQRSFLRSTGSSATTSSEADLNLQKAQREKALAEALAREEEFYLKEKTLRALKESTSASIAALNLAPVDVMAKRVEKLQTQLNAIKAQDKVKLLDQEIDEYLFENLRLPESELKNMPWAPKVGASGSPNGSASGASEKQLEIISQTIQSTTNKKYTERYPDLKISPDYKPYSKQELFLRHLNHMKRCGSFGTDLKDVYKPSDDVLKPQTVSDLSIASLMAAGCHLGHAKQIWRPSTQPFIYGEYNGVHLIDLNETLSALKRAAKIVKGVAKKGGVILYVGTTRLQEQRDALEAAAKRSYGYCVTQRWIPGTITNFTVVTLQCGGAQRMEIDLGDVNTGRNSSTIEKELIKPDLVVLMNPVENRYCIRECIKLKIPTIGLCDTDMEPSLLSYAIPCNDDSMRANSLVLGVLSKAAEEGVEERHQQFASYKRGSTEKGYQLKSRESFRSKSM